jgi:hypothetical protein
MDSGGGLVAAPACFRLYGTTLRRAGSLKDSAAG